MKALFSCDVTKSGGAGHLIRSISLAEAARARGFETVFCGRFETSFAQSILADGGFPSIAFRGDSAALANLAVEHGVTLVHCDDYKPRPHLHDALSGHGIALSTIEDSSYGSRPADVIIDPSPNAESAYRQNASSAIHLRGLAYVPLRRAISIAAQVRREETGQPATAKRGQFIVLIVLGGTDAAGATTKIVNLWTQNVSHTICLAVLPDQKMEAIETRGTSEIHWLPPSSDLATLFSKVDAVITAAGTTVWEVSAVGVAAAVIRQAENQNSNYQYVVETGTMLGLGSVDELSESESRVQEIMKRMLTFSSPTPSPVDVAGAERIVSEWVDCAGKPQALRIREARISDASNLFDWRNAEDIREVSRDGQPLVWDNHLSWLGSVISAPDRTLLIAVLGWTLAGTARFDQIDGKTEEWEISLTLSSSKRGQGLGHELLGQAERWLRAKHRGVLHVIAHVKPDNRPSSVLFAKNGYRITKTGALVQWKKQLKPPL